jgi:ATP-binding protein involved in chromosome partitioning
MDASRSLGMFRQAGVPILGVVENMSFLACPHCGRRVEVFYRSAQPWMIEGSITLLGRIPLDVMVSRPVSAEHPLLRAQSKDPSAIAFREIAATVVRMLSEGSPL